MGGTTVQLTALSHSVSSHSSVSLMLSRTGLIMGMRIHRMRNIAWVRLCSSVYQLWHITSLLAGDMADTMAWLASR